MLDLEKIEREHDKTRKEIELCCADDTPWGAIYRSFDALQEVIDEVRLLRSMLDVKRLRIQTRHFDNLPTILRGEDEDAM